MYKFVNGFFWERAKSVEIIRAKTFARANPIEIIRVKTFARVKSVEIIRVKTFARAKSVEIIRVKIFARVNPAEIIRAKVFAQANPSLGVAGDLVRGGNCHYRRLRYASPTVNRVLSLRDLQAKPCKGETLLTAGATCEADNV